MKGGAPRVVEAESPDAAVAVRRLLDAGDREGAYASVVEATRDSLYRFLLHMVRDEDAARELFQETYLRVFRGLEGFRGDAKITTWVLTIGRNQVFNRHRRGKLVEAHMKPLEHEDAHAGEGPEAEPVSRSVLEALDDLPEAQREAVYMFYAEDLSVAEVARLTGRPINTIKSDLWRGRQHLRRILDRESG
jgi:RNA polymerase sigma-70 factor (ECF subfamily)